jgi:hypothetical protein
MAVSGLPGDRSSHCSALPCGLLACLPNLLHAPHFPGCEADLDATRVERGFRKDVFHHTARKLPGTLVLLLRDVYFEPRLDVFAVLSVQALASSAFQQ